MEFPKANAMNMAAKTANDVIVAITGNYNTDSACETSGKQIAECYDAIYRGIYKTLTSDVECNQD